MSQQPLYPFFLDKTDGGGYLGSDAAMVSPTGVNCENADNAPVDLWMVIDSRAVHLVRVAGFLPSSGENDCIQNTSMAALLRDYAEANALSFFDQGFARVLLRGVNAGLVPDAHMGAEVRYHGHAKVETMLDAVSGEALTAEARDWLRGLDPNYFPDDESSFRR
jgi:hypothetical protein